jgi:hypothetical protein
MRSCINELLQNPLINKRVPQIKQIAEDVRHKVESLKWEPVPVKLDDNEMAAVVAYTHDTSSGKKNGNLYFELNRMLRQRGATERTALVETWGGFMFYMMKGLEKLPDFEGQCWRGYAHETKEAIVQQYTVGRPIQWGAFTSVTTNLAAAKGFVPDARNGIIFMIHVTSGRDVTAYSFLQEGEILLSPNHRFRVCSKPREHDGYTFIDLVQEEGSTFVS